MSATQDLLSSPKDTLREEGRRIAAAFSEFKALKPSYEPIKEKDVPGYSDTLARFLQATMKAYAGRNWKRKVGSEEDFGARVFHVWLADILKCSPNTCQQYFRLARIAHTLSKEHWELIFASHKDLRSLRSLARLTEARQSTLVAYYLRHLKQTGDTTTDPSSARPISPFQWDDEIWDSKPKKIKQPLVEVEEFSVVNSDVTEFQVYTTFEPRKRKASPPRTFASLPQASKRHVQGAQNFPDTSQSSSFDEFDESFPPRHAPYLPSSYQQQPYLQQLQQPEQPHQQQYIGYQTIMVPSYMGQMMMPQQAMSVLVPIQAYQQLQQQQQQQQQYYMPPQVIQPDYPPQLSYQQPSYQQQPQQPQQPQQSFTFQQQIYPRQVSQIPPKYQFEPPYNPLFGKDSRSRQQTEGARPPQIHVHVSTAGVPVPNNHTRTL